jgi:hypothetical protein
MRNKRNRKLPSGRYLRQARRAHERFMNHKFETTAGIQVPTLYDYFLSTKGK